MSDNAVPLAAAVAEPAISHSESEMDIKTAVAVMTVLGHKLRIEIWCQLVPHGSAGLTAGAIATLFAMKPSSISFHLQQMAKVGALLPRQHGRHTIYTVHTELVTALCQFLTSTIQPTVIVS